MFYHQKFNFKAIGWMGWIWKGKHYMSLCDGFQGGAGGEGEMAEVKGND